MKRKYKTLTDGGGNVGCGIALTAEGNSLLFVDVDLTTRGGAGTSRLPSFGDKDDFDDCR